MKLNITKTLLRELDHSLKLITFVCLEKCLIISFSLFSSVLCPPSGYSVVSHSPQGLSGQDPWLSRTACSTHTSLGMSWKQYRWHGVLGHGKGDWGVWKPGQEQPELWLPLGVLTDWNFIFNNYSVWEIASCAFQRSWEALKAVTWMMPWEPLYVSWIQIFTSVV